MEQLQTNRTSHVSRLTRKGQLTIPAAIRRRLGLKQGDRVAFVEEENTVTIAPASSIAERTAGVLRQYRRVPALSPEEEREAFARAIADEAAGDLRS